MRRIAVTKDEVMNSVRVFKSRRDSMLHEDNATFDHHFERFVQFCNTDTLVQGVIAPVLGKSTVELDEWWGAATTYDDPKISFPTDPDEEFALRFRLLNSALQNSNRVLE